MLAVKKLSGSCRVNASGTDANTHDEGKTETKYKDVEQGIRHAGDEIVDGDRGREEEQLFFVRRCLLKGQRDNKYPIK